jgi:hypothetical protein
MEVLTMLFMKRMHGLYNRYLSASLSVISSVEARSLLRDYIALNNERPSQLHSLFINLQLR